MPQVRNLKVLRRRSDFLAVAGHGRKWVTPHFVMQIAPPPADLVAEGDFVVFYGLTASRKVGGAVQRNRARRRLREVARQILTAHAVGGQAYILIAREATISCEFSELQKNLMWALKRTKSWID